MRLTKEEKERLFDLLDSMTDRCPSISIRRFVNDSDRKVFFGIFQKLRLELKGY